MAQTPIVEHPTDTPPPSARAAGEPLGGALPLFRAFGVRVSLHWSWFLVALWQIQDRRGSYDTIFWNIAEYLGLFVIVLLHEFGHALACKSVGGEAERIVLWPLGGVAFVNPPRRAGAYLWSIVAGPLVNVLLLPLTVYAVIVVGLDGVGSNVERLIYALGVMNGVMLIFNLLPVFPLDGGQILRGVLWFLFGPVRSLQAASVVGIVGAVVLAGGMFYWIRSMWIVLVAGFLIMQSLAGLKASGRMLAMRRIPRHEEYACPSCGESPPAGPMWRCERCGQPVDAFVTRSVCPSCGLMNQTTPCIWCGEEFPPEHWEATRP